MTRLVASMKAATDALRSGDLAQGAWILNRELAALDDDGQLDFHGDDWDERMYRVLANTVRCTARELSDLNPQPTLELIQGGVHA